MPPFKVNLSWGLIDVYNKKVLLIKITYVISHHVHLYYPASFYRQNISKDGM